MLIDSWLFESRLNVNQSVKPVRIAVAALRLMLRYRGWNVYKQGTQWGSATSLCRDGSVWGSHIQGDTNRSNIFVDESAKTERARKPVRAVDAAVHLSGVITASLDLSDQGTITHWVWYGSQIMHGFHPMQCTLLSSGASFRGLVMTLRTAQGFMTLIFPCKSYLWNNVTAARTIRHISHMDWDPPELFTDTLSVTAFGPLRQLPPTLR